MMDVVKKLEFAEAEIALIIYDIVIDRNFHSANKRSEGVFGKNMNIDAVAPGVPRIEQILEKKAIPGFQQNNMKIPWKLDIEGDLLIDDDEILVLPVDLCQFADDVAGITHGSAGAFGKDASIDCDIHLSNPRMDGNNLFGTKSGGVQQYAESLNSQIYL